MMNMKVSYCEAGTLVEELSTYSHFAVSERRNMDNLGGKNDKLNIDLMNKHRCKLLKVFEEEKQTAIHYELEMRKKYSKEEQLHIGSMYAYLNNKQNGFGSSNDETLFQELRQNQTLYHEALHWIENTRDYHYLLYAMHYIM